MTGGPTALIYAASNNSTACVEALLRAKGINPNIKNKKGKTALDVAKEKGHAAVVAMLETWLKYSKALSEAVKVEDDTTAASAVVAVLDAVAADPMLAGCFQAMVNARLNEVRRCD